MATEELVCAVPELPPGKVTGVGRWAVGNSKGGDAPLPLRRPRQWNHRLQGMGCLVCPWHGARYDVKTGWMMLGPQGIVAKIPGLSEACKLLTQVLPLGRGAVVERDGKIYVA
jgi:hypothetical protein